MGAVLVYSHVLRNVSRFQVETSSSILTVPDSEYTRKASPSSKEPISQSGECNCVIFVSFLSSNGLHWRTSERLDVYHLNTYI
jgi:hypothetical protein